MRFKHFKNITEATKLTPSELEKPNGLTKELRIDILSRLIRDKKPLELAKGGNFTVGEIEPALANCASFKKNSDHFGKSGFPLIATDGTEYKSNDLKKGKVFGGGIGFGGGSKDTARNESHNAAMMYAMVHAGSNNDIEYFDEKVIADAYKDNGKANISANTDTILSTPGNWWISSYIISKFLVEKGYINKDHIFDRKGPGMTMIYALKNQAYKNNGFKPLKDDKWNPGDVWAIQKGLNLKKEIDVSSVGALNTSIMNLYFDRKLVAISLKQALKYPPYNKEYNLTDPPKSPMHKLKEIKLEASAAKKSFWSSKGMEVVYDTGSLMFKDNSPGKTGKAEIKGKKARGGGLSWGVMQEFIKRETGKAPPAHASGIAKYAKNIVKGNKQAINLFWGLYNHFYPSVKRKDFEEELAKKDWFWVSAKLAVLYVGYYLSKNTGKKADAIITNFVNYAESNLLDSSTYIKVGK
tara:strand:+ start:572 stop:1972 length:1401 start_codon:yes stop_codon:yes gene_type:complete